jgi:hypothetical protein
MIASPCSITFTPVGGSAVTLVSVGDDMLSLPTFEASARLYELDGVERVEGYFRPLGGVAVSIIVEEVLESDEPHALFLDADKSGSQTLIGVPGMLAISSEVGTTTFDPAVIQIIRPGLPVEFPPVLTRVFSISAELPEVVSNREVDH